ncbi:MAG: hypothetical protein CM15mP55_2510 [Hyphomicrobiales bacterium]|nr:MAG: hypothetical protein CM15mP55_2510 [Hyphomicrobiales bacterium]
MKRPRKTEHPFVRTHHETGKKALYSSISYIQGFAGLEKEESDALLLEFYAHQTAEEITYSHKWSANMLVMWDNRALLHAATGGFDGHDRIAAPHNDCRHAVLTPSFIQPRHVMPVYWVLAFVHGHGRKFSGQPHWAISCQLAELVRL